MHQLSIRESSGRYCNAAPVKIGIPLSRGTVFPSDAVKLVSQDNVTIPCCLSATTLWPDNSIKWCLLKTSINLEPYQKLDLTLTKDDTLPNRARDIPALVKQSESLFMVRTKNACFSINSNIFGLFEQIQYKDRRLLTGGYCRLQLDDDKTALAHINNISTRPFLCHDCTHSVVLEVDGEFRDNEGEPVALFSAEIEFFTRSDSVRCAFTIHNPEAAKHTAGLWDLGDPNTLFFQGLDIGIKPASPTGYSLKLADGDDWSTTTGESFSLYQESSGGENWDSPNHVNHENRVPLRFRGYQLTDPSGSVKSGNRASPSVSIDCDPATVNFHPHRFWQNFPKSVSYDGHCLNYGIFPTQFCDKHELQPGEKKTHTFWFGISDDANSLRTFETPPVVKLNPAWIRRCQPFPFPLPESDDPIQAIISRGLDNDSDFYQKREQLDEYGWRNFGDLYADHETDGYDGDDIFVSHYNNQYDPLYGFLRQFLITGDTRWFDLADDLARHIVDIDIYDTTRDKAEYNYGLFWHTDHYLPAKTSSHRSYSRLQDKDAYEGHVGGGGPGGQHCYTTGLLYHHLLTGSESSKNAVFQLGKWIYHYYEGSGSVFDIAIGIKNRNRIDLKNILRDQYPLDRGIANYIVSALDRFYLTQEKSLIFHVEHIIRNTVSPADDISRRDLFDVENTWYYTVFLQALNRYLLIKEELQELDDDFDYALNTLLHYADWMVENEAPYLDNPDGLEFPNFTWAAQDVRKANILFGAAYFGSENADLYLQKARFFKSYAIDALNKTDTSAYTRILSILMQNHSPLDHYTSEQRFEIHRSSSYQSKDDMTMPQSLYILSKTIFSYVTRLSLRRELAWIKTRLAR